jgi:hypothetical protein
MKTVLLLAVLGSATFAQGVQNMDFSFLFGGGHTSGVIVTNPSGPETLSGSVTFSVQVSYGYQFLSTRGGSLYLEVPQTFLIGLSGTIHGPTITSLDRNSWYFTPGVRFKVPTGTRLSFYGVLGGGLASFLEQDSTVNGQVVATSHASFHPALETGGGIDLRISRWLSLRAEGRDFISAPGLGGTSGHNHTIVLGGIAFHR